MLRMARHVARSRPAMANLCLAGGVALNCVGNGRSCARGRSTSSGSSPRRATPAARSARRCSSGTSYLGQPARRRPARRRACTARSSARASRRRRDRAPSSTGGRGATAARPTRRRCSTRVGRAAGRGQGGRLVPGPDGVRPARARRPQHPRRPAQPGDAVADEPQDQVPRGVPAVRAGGAARAGRPSGSSIDADRPYMLLVAAGPDASAGSPMTADEERAVGHRQAERAALGASRRSPTSTTRRGSRPCAATTNPRYYELHHGLRGARPAARCWSTLVQRARRADRLHAGGRLPLLHADRTWTTGAVAVPACQDGSAGLA